MTEEERTLQLEKDLADTGEELKEILLDVRSYILVAHNPLRRFERKPRRLTKERGNDNVKRKETGNTGNGGQTTEIGNQAGAN